MTTPTSNIDYSYGEHLEDPERLVIRVDSGDFKGSVFSFKKILVTEDEEINPEFDILCYVHDGLFEEIDIIPEMFYNDVIIPICLEVLTSEN